MFFSLDAFFALTLAMFLAYSAASYAQHHQSQLLQFHQLGRDTLVLKYYDRNPLIDDGATAMRIFNQVTHYNIRFSTTPPAGESYVVGSKIIVYPRPCPGNNAPDCFKSQDASGQQMVYNALVSR